MGSLFKQKQPQQSRWSTGLLEDNAATVKLMFLNLQSGGEVVKEAQLYVFARLAKFIQASPFQGQLGQPERADLVAAKVSNALTNGDMGESRPPVPDAIQLEIAQRLVKEADTLPDDIRIAAAFSRIFLGESVLILPQTLAKEGKDFDSNDVDEAMSHAKASLAIYSKGVRALYSMACAWSLKARSSDNGWEKVVDLCHRATVIDPNFSEAFLMLSTGATHMGDERLAETSFKKAVDLKPELAKLR